MKRLSIIASALIISSSVYAQDIIIKQGWQLKGTDSNFTMESFKKDCINTIWTYNDINQTWNAYSPHYPTQQLIKNDSSITELKNINPTDGFWINGYSDCTIKNEIKENNITTDINTTVDDNTTTDGIIYNGLTYKTITSPVTGKVWLDRNLGASKACTSFYDEPCYGDYYQWGRKADGHEKSDSDTTDIQATSVLDVNNGGKFITTSTTSDFDWAQNKDSSGIIREADWNPCPTGYRVPTIEELKAENIQNLYDAYDKLKLPSAGFRNSLGLLDNQGSGGSLWSSSPNESHSQDVYFSSKNAGSYNASREVGISVRCIKD